MNILTKISSKVYKHIGQTLDATDVTSDFDFINSIQRPSTYVRASFNQYQCQCLHLTKIHVRIRDLISFFGLVLYLLRPNSRVKFEKKTDFSIHLQNERYLPEGVRCELIKDSDKYYLTTKDRILLMKELSSINSSWFFKLKNLIKCGIYSYYIKMFDPENIYCSSEYSFCSSFLTWYCHTKNINHINVQHGDKILNASNCFFRFDTMYIWSEYYVLLFQKLRAEVDNYITFEPPALKLDCSGIKEIYDFKYYLQDQDEATLNRIISMMEYLTGKGFTVKIRMHPRYRNEEFEKQHKEMIEAPEDISIAQSIGETHGVISMYSTVLLQGLMARKDVIIDDVSMPEKYANLERLEYAMLKETDKRLSDYVNKNNILDYEKWNEE